MTVTTIVGARPQFIKAAMVARELTAKHISERIVHTGQHYDANMSDVFFDELDIPRPDHNLGIGGGSHGQNTGRMIEAIEKLLVEQPTDLVLVYGDTDSTLAGALAAVKLHIPVAHVEAGLRSFNRRMPEEVNRVLTDHAADILFAPTTTAVKNLSGEGIAGERMHLVGDVMYDAAIFYGEKAERLSRILEECELVRGEYILATIHRAENTDDRDRLAAILEGLASSQRTIVLPLHPRTRSRLEAFGIAIADSIRVIDPVGYLDMVMLERSAALIATDSGGVQKEAFFHGTPCVTLREETEWVELVECGWNRIVPPHSAAAVHQALTAEFAYELRDDKLFGDGRTARKIASSLSAFGTGG